MTVRTRDGDESAVATILAVVGAPRLAFALTRHEVFGTEATLALACCALGLIGYLRAWTWTGGD